MVSLPIQSSLIFLAVVLWVSTLQDSPEQLFQHGKQLVEANCSDCVGATKEGLNTGIEEVKRALSLGYQGQLTAYKLLVDAYNTLAVLYSSPNSDERKVIRREQQSIYERLFKLAPKDANIRYDYAMTLNDRKEQITALRNAIRIDPNHADAHCVLGVLEAQEGAVKEAVADTKRGIRAADVERARICAKRVAEVLEGLGRKKDAESVRGEAAKRVNQQQ